MELPIFFLEKPVTSNLLTLDEDTSKHVVQVLRMKPLERLQLTDGAGSLFTAEIIDDHKKRCTVKIAETQVVTRKKQQVSVGISLLKNAGRLEWFLEKATEIGVTEIIPLLCDRTEKHQFRYDRMKQIVVSAMMQSKQVWLPVLHQPVVLSQMVATDDYETKLVAHCLPETKKSITDFRKLPSVKVIIGPEGDFTAGEISLTLSRGYQPVTLGETRLRTETAGVVAATVLCI